MTLELLANGFAFTARDPERRRQVLDAMRACGAFTTVESVGDWYLGEAAFSIGPAQPAGAVAAGVLFVQAPPELIRAESVVDRVSQRLLGADPTLVAELPGDVGAVACAPDGRSMVAMSPVGGRVPWYYAATGDEIAVGTRLAFFFHVVGRTEPDLFAHATMAGALMFPDGRTPLDGVRHLLPGHVVRLSLGADPVVTNYWVPPTPARRRPTAASSEAAAAALRDALVRALERELDPAGGNLLGLSGGVDSSSLAALAIRAAHRPLSTFSHVPKWESDHPDMAIDYIAPLVAELGITDAHRLSLDSQRYLAANRRAPRVGLAVPHQALGDLAEMVERTDARVLTGGELADDLFGGAHFLRLDWLASFGCAQMVWRSRSAGAFGARSRHLVWRHWIETRRRRWTRRPSLPVEPDLPEFFAESVRQEYREWRARYGARIARTGHPYQHVLAMLECDGWLAMNWEACSALGVRRSLPFVTREVIELSLRCHPQEHAEPSKRLLRLGLAAEVPALNLQRPDKGYWGEEPDEPEMAWSDELPAVLAPMLAPGWTPAPPRPLSFSEASLLMRLALAAEPPVLVDERSAGRAR